MANDGIKLKVGVRGVENPDTSQIAKDIKTIIGGINKSDKLPKLVIGLDVEKTANKIQKDLQTILSKTKVLVDVGANISNNKNINLTDIYAVDNKSTREKINLDKQIISNAKIKEQLDKTEIANEKLKAQISTTSTKTQINADKVAISNSKARIQAIREQNVINKQAEVQVKKIQQEELKEHTFIQKKQKLLNDISIFRQKNTLAEKQYSQQFDDLISNINKASNNTDLTKLTSNFRTLKSEIVETGNAGKTTFGQFSSNFNKFKSWLLASVSVMTIINTLRNMVSTIKELDSAITDLQIATGSNRSDVEVLLNTYTQLGKEMGATTLEVAQGADNWLRQGYNIQEANKLVKDSLVLSKLGQIDSANATQYLTSAMRGYKIEAKDAMSIVDKFTTVDMKAAVSAAYIAEAMSQTANSARISGVSMDKLVGQIAAVGEATQQSSSEIGNFYKTMYARMGNVKAGKFLSDEGEALNDVESILSGVGIKLRNSQGDFRNFGEVLDEIGAKWESYSGIEQRAIAGALGGTRQQERAISLFENYDKALEYQKLSLESAGNAQKKYDESYKQSIEFSLKSFQASWEQFSKSVMNSDLIRGVIDKGSGILGFLTDLLKVVDKLNISLPVIIGTLATVKGKGFNFDSGFLSSLINLDKNGLKQSIGLSLISNEDKASLAEFTRLIDSGVKPAKAYAKTMLNTSETAQQMAKNYQKGSGGLQSLGSSFSTAGVKAKAGAIGVGIFNAALNVGIIWAISLAVKGLAKLFDSFSTTLEEQSEKTDKAIDNYQEIATKLDDVNTKLEETHTRIDELNSKPNLTFVEKEELQKLKDTNYELEREARLLEDKAKRASEKATKEIENKFNKKNNYKDGDFEYYIKNFDPNQKLDESKTIYLQEYLDKLLDVKKELEEVGTDENNAFYKNVQKAIDLIDNKLNPEQFKQYKFDKIFSENMSDGLKSQLNSISNSASLTAEDIKTNFSSAYQALVKDGSFSEKEIVEQFNAMAQKAKEASAEYDFSDMFNDIENSAKDLSSAYQTLSDKQELSYEQINNLITKYPELLQYYDAENNTLNINKQILEGVFQQSLITTKQKLEDNKKTAESEFALAKAMLERYSIENMIASGSINSTWGWQQRNNAISQYADAQAKLAKAEAMLKGISNTSLGNYVSRSSSSKSTEDTWLKAFNDELEALKHKRAMNIISEKDYYNQLEALNKKYFANREKYLSEYWKYEEEIFSGREKLLENAKKAQQDLLNKVVELIKKEVDAKKKAYNEELEALKKIINARKEALNKKKDEDDYNKKIAEKNSNISKIKNELDELKVDKSASASKRILELQEELIKAQEDLTEYQYEHSIKTQQDAIDKELEELENLYDKKLAELDNYLNNQKQIVDDALKRILNDNGTLYQQLIDWNNKYGSAIQSDITNMWNEACNALRNYGNLLNNVNGTAPKSVSVGSSQPSSSTTTSTPTTSTTTITIGTRVKAIGYGNGASDGSANRAKIGNAGYIGDYKTGKEYPYLIKAPDGTPLGWYKLKDLQAYSKGGVANYTGLAMLHGTNSKSETIFNATDSKKLYDLVHNSSNLTQTLVKSMLPDLKGITNTSNNQSPPVVFGDIIIHGNADDNTVKQLQNVRKDIINDVFNLMNRGQYIRGR